MEDPDSITVLDARNDYTFHALEKTRVRFTLSGIFEESTDEKIELGVDEADIGWSTDEDSSSEL